VFGPRVKGEKEKEFGPNLVWPNYFVQRGLGLSNLLLTYLLLLPYPSYASPNPSIFRSDAVVLLAIFVTFSSHYLPFFFSDYLPFTDIFSLRLEINLHLLHLLSKEMSVFFVLHFLPYSSRNPSYSLCFVDRLPPTCMTSETFLILSSYFHTLHLPKKPLPLPTLASPRTSLLHFFIPSSHFMVDATLNR